MVDAFRLQGTPVAVSSLGGPAPFSLGYDFSSGLTARIIRQGFDASSTWQFVDVHFLGTATETTHLYFSSTSGMELAAEHDTWAASVAIGLVSGVPPALRIGMGFYDKHGQYLPCLEGSEADFDFVPRDVFLYGLEAQRLEWVAMARSPHVHFARQHLWMRGIEVGVAYDFVLRVAKPHLALIRESPWTKSQLSYRLASEAERERGIAEHLPAVVALLDMPPSRLFEILCLDGRDGSRFIPYFTKDGTLYICLSRIAFPYVALAKATIAYLFAINLDCQAIIISRSFDCLEEVPNATNQVAEFTSILDLPTTFEEFRTSGISRKFRFDLEYWEQELHKKFDSYSFEFSSGKNFSIEKFQALLHLMLNSLCEASIDDTAEENPQLPDWLEKHSPILDGNGFSVALMSQGKPITVAIGVLDGQDYHIIASAYDPICQEGNISSVFLYRLIDQIIENGGRRMLFWRELSVFKRNRFGIRRQPTYNIFVMRTRL
jgi:hypothetical protein